jgi:CRP/FNR family transcriptional regulator
MDFRLAHKLLELAHGGDQVAATQQQLASELGTAREVVSRVLSELQRRGWIATTRGHIIISDRAALEKLAGER